MASLTAKDILTFLDGNASPELLKSLQLWTESKPKRARKLARYQKIYDEFPHLREYKLFESDEYEKFQEFVDKSLSSKLDVATPAEEITELDILHYVSGHKGPKLSAKIEAWTMDSADNAKTLEDIQQISAEGEQLDSYRKFDGRLEYENIKKIIDRRSEKVVAAPTYVSKPQVEHKEERNRMALWPIILGLALLLGLAYGAWYLLNNGKGNKALFASTEAQVKNIEISDGSQIVLGEDSKLEYFSNAEELGQRMVKLNGVGEFNIASYQEKIFKAHIEDDIVVSTQSANFIIEESAIYSKVIRNKSGALHAYASQDSSVNINIAAGEAYGFDGERFVKIVEEIDIQKGKEYQVLYVIDYLMQNSGWRVTTAPYKTIRKSDKVFVDLDQPYEAILDDLVRSTDFAYDDMDCQGCYRITRFAAK